jgi:hypothetical protein
MALAGGALRLRLAGLRLGNAQCRGSRAGQGVAIARNPWSRFPDVCDPDHRPHALRKGGQSVESAAKLRLGLAPSPIAALSVDTSGLAQIGSPKRPAFGPHPPPTPLPIPADRAAAPPEPHRSLPVAPLIGDQRCYGEAPVRPARGSGGVSQGIAGALRIFIWQHRHKGLSASHWQPGTCGANASLRLDCAKSLLEVQIRIQGSDRVRSPWGMGILRPYSSYSCTSAPSSLFKT